MKVLGIPVKNRDLSSCRIRYYSFLENLPEGWTFETYNSKMNWDEIQAKYDLIYIQKAVRDWTLSIARIAKKRGIPLVFDRDDFQKCWHKPHSDMMDLANAVTTDTEANAGLCKKHTKTPVYVVPDCIDYGITKKDRAFLRKDISKVVTYGRHANVESIAPYFKAIQCATSYICDRKFRALRKSKYITWKRKTFVSHLKAHDAVVLTHNKDHRVPYKPATRAVVAMALGVPVIATSSPAFKEAFAGAGHPHLIIESPSDAALKVNYLQDIARRKVISDDLFNYAWSNYEPKKSSRILANIMEGVECF